MLALFGFYRGIPCLEIGKIKNIEKITKIENFHNTHELNKLRCFSRVVSHPLWKMLNFTSSTPLADWLNHTVLKRYDYIRKFWNFRNSAPRGRGGAELVRTEGGTDGVSGLFGLWPANEYRKTGRRWSGEDFGGY